MALPKSLQAINAGEGMEWVSYTVDGNINWYSHCGERFLKKLTIEMSYDPAIPLLDINPEKNHNSKGHMYTNVHCSTIYNSQVTEMT